MPSPHKNWPPVDAPLYIRSDAFARLVISLVEDLASKYSEMDFSDAVASLFTWLDTKLETERDFINVIRFPSERAFVAYLRQAAWNVGRVAARQRRQEGLISELPSEFEPVSPDASPEVLAMIQECKERLPHLQRRTYELWVQEDIPEEYHCDRLPYVTSIMQAHNESFTEQDILELYAKACDALYLCITGKQPPPGRPRAKRAQ